MIPNKALWAKGDFTQIAVYMPESAEALVDTLGVGPGMKVLDLACRDSTTALPSAMRGAQVLGIDIAANPVAAGNARAARGRPWQFAVLKRAMPLPCLISPRTALTSWSAFSARCLPRAPLMSTPKCCA